MKKGRPGHRETTAKTKKKKQLGDEQGKFRALKPSVRPREKKVGQGGKTFAPFFCSGKRKTNSKLTWSTRAGTGKNWAEI